MLGMVAAGDETLGRRFKHWFWRLPRSPGRSVSVVELFHDLVYWPSSVTRAHHRAEQVSAGGVRQHARYRLIRIRTSSRQWSVLTYALGWSAESVGEGALSGASTPSRSRCRPC